MNGVVLQLERVSVRYRKTAATDAVSFAVERGSVYALLGRSGAGKSSLVACVLGEKKPAAGRVLVFGRDARRHRRAARQSLRLISGATDRARVAQALGFDPKLIVLDDPILPPGLERSAVEDDLADAASRRGLAILFATRTPSDAERIADRVGILHRGRLVIDEDVSLLTARFRRLRYRNEITPTRTEYGNELDLFDAVRVRVRGWGIEAIVSNYSPEAFDRFRSIDGVFEARETEMTLSEIFEAVSPERSAGGSGA